MSYEDYQKYKILYQLRPFGPRYETYLTGVIVSTLANVNGAKLSPSDFFEELKDPKPSTIDSDLSIKQIRAKQHSVMSSFGASF